MELLLSEIYEQNLQSLIQDLQHKVLQLPILSQHPYPGKYEVKILLKDLEVLSRKTQQTQIFMETPYRNIQLFESILKVCSKSTKLCIASNITLDSENIKTKTIEEWKLSNPPNIHKSPTIFLIHAR